MKTFFHLVTLLCLSTFTQAQVDYRVVSRYPEGVALISKVVDRIKTEARYGLLDEKTNKVILPIAYRSIYASGEKDLFIVKDTLDKQGLYSLKKDFVVLPSYKEIKQFSEGYAVVLTGGKTASTNLSGVIDVNGKLIIPFEYDYIGPASEGLFNFRSKGKFGFINEKNEIVIPSTLLKASTFRSGLTPAFDEKTMKYGYLNKKNEFVIPPQYKNADDFFEGYAKVYRSSNENTRSGVVDTNDTAGLINTKGKLIIPMIYNDISFKQNGVFIVTLDKKQGLYDSTGKLLLPPDEQSFGYFSGNGLGTLKKNNKWGLVTNHGKILLPAEYDYIYGMPDYTILTRKNKSYSVVDVNLKTIIPADTFEAFLTNSKKFFAGITNNEVKVYTRTGKLVKTIRQNNIKPFSVKFNAADDSLLIEYGKTIFLFDIATGRKTLLPYEGIGNFNAEGIAPAQNSYGSFYFLDKNGKALNDTPYTSILNFSDGIAGVQKKTTEPPYLIDRSFNKIAELTTKFYGPYSDGLAKSMGPNQGTVNYLDKKGNIVISISATDGMSFKEGRAPIMNAGSKWYFIDRQGKTITKELYENATYFSEGLAAVQKDNKWGYVDTSGNVVIPFKYDGVSPFQENVAMVKLGEELFLVSRKGEPVNNDKYSSANNPVNGSFPVKKGERFGLIDSKGNVVAPFNYENIFPLSGGFTWAMKNEKWGLVNSAGKELTAFLYDNVGEFTNGYAIAEMNKKSGMVDTTGKVVVPLEYDQLSTAYDKRVMLVVNKGKLVVGLPK